VIKLKNHSQPTNYFTAAAATATATAISMEVSVGLCVLLAGLLICSVTFRSVGFLVSAGDLHLDEYLLWSLAMELKICCWKLCAGNGGGGDGCPAERAVGVALEPGVYAVRMEDMEAARE
jgi:hypothetical protein